MSDDKDKLKELQKLSTQGGDIEKELLTYIAEHDESYMGHLLLGGLYFTQDKLTLARPYFERVLSVKPSEPNSNTCMFHILWENKERNEAMLLIQKYLDGKHPDTDDALIVKNQFEEIRSELMQKRIWLNA